MRTPVLYMKQPASAMPGINPAKTASSLPDRPLILAALLVVPFLAGCAQIKTFNVAPSTICPGETVKIDWAASGNNASVMLDAVPPLTGIGEVPAEGSRMVTPVESTRFILKVPGVLKSVQREWDVQVVPRESARTWGGIAECSGQPQSISVSFTIQQQDTSPGIHAELVTNSYLRPLIVRKDDMEVEIPPKDGTDRFKNVPAMGTWTIASPVAPEETCESALAAVARRLTVNMQMSCAEQKN
ncbi:MAG: hypothetical protein NTAFB09_07240 [Nitrosospira sp.]